MAYGDFKDLTRRTDSDKILCNKGFNIAKYPKYDGYQRGLASVVYQFFDKKTSGGTVKNENISNKELPERLRKRIIRIFKKGKVHSSCTGNICGADHADRQLLWVFPLHDKGRIAILNEPNRKPKKIQVNKGREFRIDQ